MADETTPTVKPGQMPDPAKNNAEVAAKQAAQDISGQSTVTGEFGDATSALDALAAQVKPAEVTPAAEDTPAKKTDAADPKADAAAPKVEVPAPDVEALKKADEYFKDSPKLPPNASPKSSEAFSSIKLKAAKEISEREQKIEELTKKLESSKNPTPEILEKEKELEELRSWRTKVDVDFDPKFKEYDKTVEASREFIYAQLAKSPAFPPEVIEQIKKYGGPDKVNLVKLFETANDPTLQRLVESKVADIAQVNYNREQAVKAAKENLAQYTKDRQETTAKAAGARTQEVTANLSEYLGKFDWLAEKKAEAGATDDAKKEIADHNAFVVKLNSEIKEAMADDSPQMRAILIAGYAKLSSLQRAQPILEAKLAAAEKALAETTSKWEKVKNSSRSRLEESAAPSGGIPVQKTGTDFSQRPGDALDSIARSVMEKRAQAAGQ